MPSYLVDGYLPRSRSGELAELIGRLRAALSAHPGGTSVYLEIVRPGAFRALVRTEPSWGVAPSPGLSEALEAIVGPGRVRYRARSARRAQPSAS